MSNLPVLGSPEAFKVVEVTPAHTSANDPLRVHRGSLDLEQGPPLSASSRMTDSRHIYISAAFPAFQGLS
jgi:hypothetical protein